MLGENEDDELFTDLNGFDFDSALEDHAERVDRPVKQRTRFARVKAFKRPRMVKYANAQAAARDIGQIEVGEHVEMLVSGDFVAGDFIEAYMEQAGLVADEIILSTLSMSSENVDSLKLVKDCYMDGIMGLIVSDYFFAMERRGGIQDIIERLSGADFFLAVAGIHTKITLIKTQCGQYLVLGGSANLRSSRNIEQMTIDSSAELYQFHRGWMAPILNDYQVKHNMVRRKQLWQQVEAN